MSSENRRSRSPASYISSSSEDDISLNGSRNETSKSTKKVPYSKLKAQISQVDPSVLNEIEDQAKTAAKSIEKLMGFLGKELHNGTKATENIVNVYDGAIDHVYNEVEGNIKAMYTLIAKCEELDRKMKPITELAQQVKEIRETLDALEMVCNS